MSPETRDKLVVYGLGGLLTVLIGLNLWWFLLRGGSDPDALLDQPAPAVQLPLLADGEFQLAEHKGQVVLLDFWAIYCGPCKRQMPILEELKAELAGQDLTIISVNTDDPREKDRAERVRAYIESNHYSLTVAMDNGRAARDFGVARIPTLVIIDREGSIRYIHTGLASKDALNQQLRRLLAPSA